MLLHEAIVEILKKFNLPMSTSDIAVTINRNGLYSKKDGSPVTSSQISARIRKYLHLFERSDDGIKLVKTGTSFSSSPRRKECSQSVSVELSTSHLNFTNEDVTNSRFLKTKGFKYIGEMGKLIISGLPHLDILTHCGIYAITIPSNYNVAFISPDNTSTRNNVVKPWSISKLQNKWIEGVDVVYYGLAGKSSIRPLKKRLRDLISHCSGKTTDRGPHCGGEILWQLEGYEQFGCWVHPTDDPPIPRVTERRLLEAFFDKIGKLPFANRQF